MFEVCGDVGIRAHEGESCGIDPVGIWWGLEGEVLQGVCMSDLRYHQSKYGYRSEAQYQGDRD